MTKDQKQKEIRTMVGEMLLQRLLGRVFITYPYPEKQDWFVSLLDSELFMDTPFAQERPEVQQGLVLLRSWIDENRWGSREKTLLDLQADATQLFHCTNTILAPPWESVYKTKDRLVMQEHTVKVRRFYRKHGLVLDEDLSEPDDHIGLELLFVSYLTQQMAEALEEEDWETFDKYLEAKHVFLSDHLLQWALLFCSQVEKYAKTDFYHGMSLLLKGIILEMADNHSIEIPFTEELHATA